MPTKKFGLDPLIDHNLKPTRRKRSPNKKPREGHIKETKAYRSFDEIAARIGVTHQRAHQAHDDAIAKLIRNTFIRLHQEYDSKDIIIALADLLNISVDECARLIKRANDSTVLGIIRLDIGKS